MKDILEEMQQETQRRYDEQKRMEKELSERNEVRLHYIFTLSLSEYPFLDLKSIDGWYKYINLNISMFNKYFKCERSHYFINTENLNTEQFLLGEINSRSDLQMYKCSFENVVFDVCTNGKVFEIILKPDDEVLGLDFSNFDHHKLSDFFKRWCGEVLVKSLKLNNYIDKDIYNDSIYKSIYDPILNLDHCSFVVYTYPFNVENKNIEKLIENRFQFFKGSILDNLWVTSGANIRDRNNSPNNSPFQEYSVHIKGHVPINYSPETQFFLRMMYYHMNYWSMINILESFMGISSSFQDFEVYSLNVSVKKRDSFKRLLFGKEKKHTQIESLRNIKGNVHHFLQFAIKFNHRGLEEDVSETYILKNIAGEYFNLFEKKSRLPMTKFLDNVDEKSLDDLRKEYHETIDDLEKRMSGIIEKTRDLEEKYYQEYQLKYLETTQELTIISIISGIIVFIISKIPFGMINQANILMRIYYLYHFFFISFFESIILNLLKLFLTFVHSN